METLIRRRYRPLEVIGRGGQGSVLKALDERHDRLVAVKIRHVGSEQDRAAILAEARILLNLRPHPNVALVREDFFVRDNYHLVMDWVEGHNLQDVLRRHGSPGLPLEDVLRWLAQVAEAIDHLHAHQPPIVHKDLKPANIIATPSGTAVLVDFGISVAAGVEAGRAGTAGYIAPEIGWGLAPGPAVDVFGLTATAVALVTGSPPLPGRRPAWVEFDRARARRLDLAVRRGLATDPTRRPATATALVEMMRTGGGLPNNVPLDMTTFVGREHEIAEVQSLLATARLLTLSGAGGVGKTRLAYRVAGKLAGGHPDGERVVELGAISDPALVPQRVAAELRVRERSDVPIEEALIDHLRTRTLLLVLDNCEHLSAACADLIARILRTCPHVRIIATSRESLGVEGEQVWRVPALKTIDPARPLEELARSDAVRLFVDRATLVKPGFELTPVTGPAVAEICERLDGIPLAIELAAARTNIFSVAEIARRLGDRLGLLTSGSRTAPPHHQTLRGAMDWSYALLTDSERFLFARLAVFSGGFTIEAVESVCGLEDPTSALGGLVDKSLVMADEVSGETRYSMLQIVQDYASIRLEETGEKQILFRRHLERYRALAERAERELTGAKQATWVDRLEAEVDNLRAAMERSLRGSADPSSCLRMCTSVWRFWIERGYVSEGRSWVDRALRACDSGDGALCAKARVVAGVLASEQGNYEAARRHYDEGLAAAQEIGDDVLMGWIQNDLGVIASRVGDLDEARARYEQSLTVKRRLGDRQAVAVTIGNLGVLSLLRGEYAASRALLEESLGIDQELGATPAVAHHLYYFGDLSLAEGDHVEAGTHFGEALRALMAEPGGRGLLPACLEGLAAVAARRGDHARVARLVGAAESLRWAMALPVAPYIRGDLEPSVLEARAALGAESFDAAYTEGKSMPLEAVVALALSV